MQTRQEAIAMPAPRVATDIRAACAWCGTFHTLLSRDWHAGWVGPCCKPDKEGNAMGVEGTSPEYRAGVAECASDVVEGLPPRYLAGEARDNARAFAAEGDEGGTRFWVGYADAARLWERENAVGAEHRGRWIVSRDQFSNVWTIYDTRRGAMLRRRFQTRADAVAFVKQLKATTKGGS